MTPEQYDRWKDFAVRMARHAYAEATEARRLKIEEEVKSFFSWYDREPETVAKIVGWDTAPTFVCDEVRQHLEEHDHYSWNSRKGEEVERGNKFKNQVSCCIRAGLDRASEPSAGVLGFTVGDLRMMYPEGLPAWVIEGYEPPITHQTPDSMGVWL